MTVRIPDIETMSERVAVVGAGVMGHGIAIEFARFGSAVTVYDVDADALESAADRIDASLTTFVASDRLSRSQADTIADRISYESDLRAAVEDAKLVTEAAPEEIDTKRQVFDRLDTLAPEEAVLVTNTSGLSITEIAAATDRPHRVAGTHWFNPPYIVPLVELIPGEDTHSEVIDRLYELFERMEKTPVALEEEIPGFIGNRIQLAMAYEALSLLEQGVASPEAIDRAVKAGFGFRLPILGIFEKMDHSGLDVHLNVEEYLLPDLDRGTEPSEALQELVAEGRYGLKTGAGIYDWTDTDTEAVFRARDEGLLSVLDTYRERD
ncbi:MAG: 3-hydroxyacyl-CoA dehydrogenase family protein [Halobacteriales archaeon]